jgi:arylsulfatase A-like enzyme
VRFVQLFHRGWDHHGDSPAHDLMSGLPKMCRETDQPAAALITDLKQRGLLEDTLVVWGGEFGRTPMNEGRGGPNNKYLGRDHHPRAFTYWMAGGGMKPGTIYGETDELGYNIVKNPVHVHDLHATILHAMGVEHTKQTFRFQGRDYRLTDVFGNVVKDVLA